MNALITALALIAQPNGADLVTFADVDADSNGEVTLTELHAVAPDVTEDEFSAFDADADGVFGEAEFDTWLAAYAADRTDEPDADGTDDPARL